MKAKPGYKLVAERSAVEVGRPGGKSKLKLIPISDAHRRSIWRAVPIRRDAGGRQVKFMRGEFRKSYRKALPKVEENTHKK